MADVKPIVNYNGVDKQIATGDTVGVPNGGTGATTFTDGGLLVGNGTGVVQSTTAGTAGQPMVSNGTGVDPTFQSSYIGKSIAIYKPADETVSSSNTLQDDDDFYFSVGANETWIGVLFLVMSANSSGGAKAAFTIPSGAAGSMQAQGTALNFASRSITSSSGGTGAILSFQMVQLKFKIVNSSNAGTLRLQWAQNSSTMSGTTVYEGSVLQAIRVV